VVDAAATVEIAGAGATVATPATAGSGVGATAPFRI